MITSIIGFIVVLALILRMPMQLQWDWLGSLDMHRKQHLGHSFQWQDGLSLIPRRIMAFLWFPVYSYGSFCNKGVIRELYRVSYVFLGHFKGGLAMATIMACGGFAAICGSSLATAATMSKVALPEMRKYGYSDELSTASIAAGGTLGILIPPSVILVIYGLLTETSIGKLFIAEWYRVYWNFFLSSCSTVHRHAQFQSGPAGEVPVGKNVLMPSNVWAVTHSSFGDRGTLWVVQFLATQFNLLPY